MMRPTKKTLPLVDLPAGGGGVSLASWRRRGLALLPVLFD